MIKVLLAFGAIALLSACAGRTTGATRVTDFSATLHASARCDKGEVCRWYFEYWPASEPRSRSSKTPVRGPVTGPIGPVNVSARVSGLFPNTPYRWVFCGSPNDGAAYACVGPNGALGSTTADPPPDFATFTTLNVGTLIEHWNGSVWHVQASPNPGGGAQPNTLAAVSCTAATACTAVGRSGPATSFATSPLAERWDGTAWTVQPTFTSDALFPSFAGVSCASATACVAVGEAIGGNVEPSPMAGSWNGSTWTFDSFVGAINGSFGGVSCTSASSCTAAGSRIDPNTASNFLTLAERWDGSSWTIQTTPNPVTSSNAFLSDVSCTSVTACTAVGNYQDSTGATHPLAERWDGTTWTIQAVPTPGGATNVNPSGVSCTSDTTCMAVGSYTDSSRARHPLAERWDGTAWSIQPTPDPPPVSPAGADLNEVSCSSPIACTAVGARIDAATGVGQAQHPVAERWDGAAWTIQPTPSPTTNAVLQGVSCPAAGSCTAVGQR